MSAHFILRYRGQPVRFTFHDGKSIWGIVPANMATPFTSQSEAYTAALTHNIPPEDMVIEDRNHHAVSTP